MTPNRRSTDVMRLSFPLQVVICIVATAVTATVSIWASQSTLRSDVRDIRTRMEMQAQTEAASAKLAEERMAALREAVASMQRRQELQQYEIQQLKEAVLKIRPQQP